MTMEWINTCAADVNTWAEPFEHIVLGFASLVGGAWIILRLVRERKWDSALAIDIKSSFVPDKRLLTFIEVRLRNKGKVQLRAKVYRSEEGLAFGDGVENLKHSCSLRVKKLISPLASGDSWIDWFDNKNFDSPQLDEINLLNEYEDPKQNNRTDFWMEPGEVYKLGVPLTLNPGIYLAKVTFVGNRSDSEFWSRIALVKVPSSPETADHGQ